jgi:superfamily II DNA or RNA helicase
LICAAEKWLLRSLANEVDSLRTNHPFWTGLAFSPLPHQVRAVERIMNVGQTSTSAQRRTKIRMLLCDEVGMGKSFEAGLVLHKLRLEAGEFGLRVLVICPPHLVLQWVGEMQKFFSLPFRTFRGANSLHNDFLVGSVDTLSRYSTDIWKTTSYDMIIVDEAHEVTNFTSNDSLRYQLIKHLLSPDLDGVAPHSLFLTGTPFPAGKVLPFFRLLELLKPGLKKLRLARELSSGSGSETAALHMLTTGQLKRVIDSLVIRQHRADARDYHGRPVFKPHRSNILKHRPTWRERLVLAEADRLITAGLLRERSNGTSWHVLRERFGHSIPAALETVAGSLDEYPGSGKLLRLAEKHLNFIPGETIRIHPVVRDVKWKCLKKAICKLVYDNPIRNQRILIFTGFSETAAYLKLRLEAAFAVTAHILDSKAPTTIPDRFKREGTFLIAMKAGNRGLNLQFCNTIINYDLPWTASELEQRIGRVDRLGRSRPARIINLLSLGTHQERQVVLRLQSRLDRSADIMSVLDSDNLDLGDLDTRKYIPSTSSIFVPPPELNRTVRQLMTRAALSKVPGIPRLPLCKTFDGQKFATNHGLSYIGPGHALVTETVRAIKSADSVTAVPHLKFWSWSGWFWARYGILFEYRVPGRTPDGSKNFRILRILVKPGSSAPELLDFKELTARLTAVPTPGDFVFLENLNLPQLQAVAGKFACQTVYNSAHSQPLVLPALKPIAVAAVRFGPRSLWERLMAAVKLVFQGDVTSGAKGASRKTQIE